MKTKTLLVLFTTAAALAIAQTPVYTAAEAAKHVGEIATITDKVDGVHQSGKPRRRDPSRESLIGVAQAQPRRVT